jgi:hypothetical protein
MDRSKRESRANIGQKVPAASPFWDWRRPALQRDAMAEVGRSFRFPPDSTCSFCILRSTSTPHPEMNSLKNASPLATLHAQLALAANQRHHVCVEFNYFLAKSNLRTVLIR